MKSNVGIVLKLTSLFLELRSDLPLCGSRGRHLLNYLSIGGRDEAVEGEVVEVCRSCGPSRCRPAAALAYVCVARSPIAPFCMRYSL